MSTRTRYERLDGILHEVDDERIVNADEIGSIIGNRAVMTSGISVGASATLLTAGHPFRRTILIENIDSANMFIGGPNVSTSNGIRLIPDTMIELAMGSGVQIYGISAGTVDCRVLEIG